MSDLKHPAVNRLKSIRETINQKIVELPNIKLYGIWKNNFSVFYKDILEAIDSDINNLLNDEDELNSVLESGSLVRICSQLESLIFTFERIITSELKNSSLHEFISWITRQLKLSDTIHYLICDGSTLYTYKPLEFLRIKLYGSFFTNLHSVRKKYKEEFVDFYIISVPPLIISTKPYWSVIAHEIGHIIIDIHDLVVPFYPVPSKDEKDTPAYRNHYYSIEYVSDYIGNAAMGPVFHDIIFELLYDVKLKLSGTHPPYDARLYFLQSKLIEVNENSKNGKTLSYTKVEKINTEKLSTLFTEVRQIDEIVSKTKKKVFEELEISFYSTDEKELEKAAKNISELIPYIGSPPVLLNSYWKNKDTIIENIKNILGETNHKNAEKEVGRIIEESIRLTNMKETFCRMV